LGDENLDVFRLEVLQADPLLIDMIEKSLRNTPMIGHAVNSEAMNVS